MGGAYTTLIPMSLKLGKVLGTVGRSVTVPRAVLIMDVGASPLGMPRQCKYIWYHVCISPRISCLNSLFTIPNKITLRSALRSTNPRMICSITVCGMCRNPTACCLSARDDGRIRLFIGGLGYTSEPGTYFLLEPSDIFACFWYQIDPNARLYTAFSDQAGHVR